MLKENKARLDDLLNQSKRMHDKFAAKGMPMVPVPYMGELVVLLRKMPADADERHEGKLELASSAREDARREHRLVAMAQRDDSRGWPGPSRTARPRGTLRAIQTSEIMTRKSRVR